jgi:AAHS family 4-hydroxybenzoate transporter-like MFS transporter
MTTHLPRIGAFGLEHGDELMWSIIPPEGRKLMDVGKKLDLESIIDFGPVGRLQIIVVALCALMAMMDGFDTQVIAFAAPEIASAWRVEPSVFGPVFGVGLFGGLIGAMIFGSVGDRFGRKPTLVFAVVLFAVGSLITPLTETVTSLSVIRLVTGIGLGGAVPNFISLTSEYLPRRLRVTLVGLMFCGYPLGAVIGGAASAKLIPAFGWKSVFLAGGLIPLLVLPLFMILVPESVRFLALKKRHLAVSQILKRMNCSAAWSGEVTTEPPETRAPVYSLFSKGRALGTVLLWATFFFSLMFSYFLVNWIPIVVRRSGLDIENAVLAVAVLNLGAIAGCLVLGRLADRLGQARVIGWAFTIGALAIALVGQAGHSSVLLFAACFTAGFFGIGAQLCNVAFGAGFYETFLRATGVGWSIGVGRIGAIVGPILGGLLIGGGASPQVLFAIAGLMSLGAAIAVFAIGRFVLRAPRPQFLESPASLSIENTDRESRPLSQVR